MNWCKKNKHVSNGRLLFPEEIRNMNLCSFYFFSENNNNKSFNNSLIYNNKNEKYHNFRSPKPTPELYIDSFKLFYCKKCDNVYYRKKESIKNHYRAKHNRNAICLLVVNPSTIMCDFLKNIKTHHIYMIVDNNEYDLTEFKEKYFNINFIQIDDHVCSSEGFVNANTWGIKKTPTAWDKVFYYFGVKNVTYDNVWILEEDVFVRNNLAFKNLDNLYPEEDLLVSKNHRKTEDSKWLYWNFGEGKIDTHLYHSMVCSCRVSNKLFEKIKKYADENKTLFYIEIMINTIANKYKLNISCPNELSTIGPKPEKGKRYRVKLDNGKWDWVSSELPKNIKENYMYHPVKKIQLHRDWRKPS